MGTVPESADGGAGKTGRVILSADDISRVVDRISHQILEKTGGATDVVLVGIPTRGQQLAERIRSRIEAFSAQRLPIGVLDITLYRDDLRTRGVRPLEHSYEPEGGIDQKTVVLIDDVLYSGRTIRAALDALRDWGRPRAIQAAVLVDRGHRELPIRADYVGKNIPTARDEQIFVGISELDGVDGVVISSGQPDRHEVLAMLNGEGR
ncbi:bifunctional pyr operon transcriptional regulator/uracil phosphoribosyltransferase PyrR [Cumulibacter soli]|uniref:bifunctional pyr operon transcriptional regulator/uracil phosphoribosyltransferase PyrR n=1 Tax=Cumulibacter soli TaxID=2546344 RepID=UPI001067A113|nr:bifunctional pyr operon transcriptional regulator/uracil phosphoribosyltransferase PyrR [Cumulibacter soli]